VRSRRSASGSGMELKCGIAPSGHSSSVTGTQSAILFKKKKGNIS
jgi:hypothetical protein